MEHVIEKWGGRPHYRGTVDHVGDDADGTWLLGPSGRAIHRGDDIVFTTEQDALSLVVADAWWTPTWWIGHPDVALYVNINTPVTLEGDRYLTIDLDLDVVRFTDGRVEIVDRDEFEVHRELYGYPADVVAAAEAAASDTYDLVVRDTAPFDGASAANWADRLGLNVPGWRFRR